MTKIIRSSFNLDLSPEAEIKQNSEIGVRMASVLRQPSGRVEIDPQSDTQKKVQADEIARDSKLRIS